MTSPGPQLLKEWISRSRLKQNELAARLDITDSYLSQVLSGLRRPKLEILVAIERMTGVPVESWVDIPVADSDESSAKSANSIVS